MKRLAMIALMTALATTAFAQQTHMQRMTQHRLPDREPGLAPLQLQQLGRSESLGKVDIRKTSGFDEYSYSVAKFVTTDGRKPILVHVNIPTGMPVYLDEVHMEFEGKSIKPVKATADGVDVTKKLRRRDEQCTCFQDLIIEFPPTGKADISEATIVFLAGAGKRAEIKPIEREDQGPKVYQAKKYYNYTPGLLRGIIEYDGTITPKDELGQANFKEYVQPIEGGKKEPLHIWVRDDGNDLYVVLDVAADTSVDDADDKTILYVRGDGPLKSFVAGAGGGEYGKMGAAYTGTTYAEHRVYEFRVPFSQLPALDGKGKWGLSFAVTM
jgi:hypothetical protein